MNFTRLQIADACRQFGNSVYPLPTGIDGAQTLFAISGNESSFGFRCTPRHEPAYDIGGTYSTRPPMPELLEKYGSDAACSYGPWQVLLVNAPSYSPSDFDDIEKCAQATVSFLNSLLRRFKPNSLSDIGSCWNAGHIQKQLSPGVERYVSDLQKNYQATMPVESL
jgi:hypothetical protein